MVGARTSTCELLTPRGHGGVAVVAVRGEGRWRQIGDLVRGRDGGEVLHGHGPQLVTLYLDGQAADQILLVDRGDCLELHLHGSPAVVESLENAVGGFVVACPVGSRQRLLETARSRAELDLCLEQAGFDFDMELQAAELDEPALARIQSRSHVALAHFRPCRLVICGAQNAGKSTLMNRLLFQERVLTGDLPGLTRDPVREIAVLGGYPYELVDTAGEGEVHSTTDREALLRARREREGSMRLLVVEGSAAPTETDFAMRDADTVVIGSKADLGSADWPEHFVADVCVSCLDPLSAPGVRSLVGEKLRDVRGLPLAGPVSGVAAVTDQEITRVDAAIATLQSSSA